MNALEQLQAYAAGGELPDPAALAWAISVGYLTEDKGHVFTQLGAKLCLPEHRVLVAIRLGSLVKTQSGTVYNDGAMGWVLNSGTDKRGKEWIDVLLKGTKNILRLFDVQTHQYAKIAWPVGFSYVPYERNLWPEDLV